jgi:hypothetical protein
MRVLRNFPVRIYATGSTSDWGDRGPDLWRFADEYRMMWFGGKRDMMFPRELIGLFTIQMRV